MDEDCPVCLEECDDYVNLICSHKVCLKCFIEMYVRGHLNCPICRNDYINHHSDNSDDNEQEEEEEEGLFNPCIFHHITKFFVKVLNAFMFIFNKITDLIKEIITDDDHTKNLVLLMMVNFTINSIVNQKKL